MRERGALRAGLDRDLESEGLGAGRPLKAVSYDGEVHIAPLLSTDSALEARDPGRKHRARSTTRCLHEPGAKLYFRYRFPQHFDHPGSVTRLRGPAKT